jgi:hypothetical protein
MSPEKKPVTLRNVAERVGLAPCSVSAILNNTPAAQAIPQTTKERVFRAAAALNYCPNLWARSLRTKRTRMVAAVCSDFGVGKVARVIAGLQRRLNRSGYLLVLGVLDSTDAHHAGAQFQQRGIEGVVAIDASVPLQFDLPAAYVDLSYMNPADPLSNEMQAWLSELGASAAETVIRQIEKDTTGKTSTVGAKLPPARCDGLEASLGREVDARESA